MGAVLPSHMLHVSTALGSTAELAQEVATEVLRRLSLPPTASAGQFVNAP